MHKLNILLCIGDVCGHKYYTTYFFALRGSNSLSGIGYD